MSVENDVISMMPAIREEDREFAAEFMRAVLAAKGINDENCPDLDAVVAKALKSLAAMLPHERTATRFAAILECPRSAAAMLDFSVGEEASL